MKKTFDCVEMKHRGAEKVQAQLAEMTLEEQLRYWEERGHALEAKRQRLIRQRKAS
jgi:hypothetical protein